MVQDTLPPGSIAAFYRSHPALASIAVPQKPGEGSETAAIMPPDPTQPPTVEEHVTIPRGYLEYLEAFVNDHLFTAAEAGAAGPAGEVAEHEVAPGEVAVSIVAAGEGEAAAGDGTGAAVDAAAAAAGAAAPLVAPLTSAGTAESPAAGGVGAVVAEAPLSHGSAPVDAGPAGAGVVVADAVMVDALAGARAHVGVEQQQQA